MNRWRQTWLNHLFMFPQWPFREWERAARELQRRKRERHTAKWLDVAAAIEKLQARSTVEQELRDFAITETMLRMGGSFVQQLAMLFRAADPINQRRVKTAFSDYWTKYADLTRPLPEDPSDPRD